MNEKSKPLREILKSREAILSEFDDRELNNELRQRVILETMLEIRDMMMGFIDGINSED